MKTTPHSSSRSLRSFKRKRLKKAKSNEDIISSLPDETIHHIFSFMDMRDVVNTSILSNRWKTLWLSTPILNFSLYRCPDCTDTDDYCDDLCDACPKGRNNYKYFVDRVLILRGNFKIDKFNLCFRDTRVKIAQVHTWILAALGRNARQLLLDVSLSCETWVLPHKLFTSNITLLKLWFYGTSGASGPRVRLPSLICNAPRIKNLQLRGVGFPDGNANRELIMSCPVLETLNITQCDLSNIQNFIISTPQLESLELVDIYTKRDKSCRLKTCIPNLKMIKVKVDSSSGRGINMLDNAVDYCLESLTSLTSAEVGFNSDFPKAFSKCLIKVLNGIHNVRFLKLADVSLQLLKDFPESLEQLSDAFCNLKSVVLELGSPSVHSVLIFLERFPCIETLVWDRHLEKVKHYQRPFLGEKWIDLPFQRIFSSLKTFEIRNLEGLKLELKFLELLLQKAVVLEDMIINTTGPCSLAEMLQSLPRASSSASIVFTQSCRAITLEDSDP